MVGDQRVLFIAFGDRWLASSRIRAWQVVDAWPEASCVQWDEQFSKCVDYDTLFERNGMNDVVVIQKLHPNKRHHWCLHLASLLKNIHNQGKTLIWDLCDAIWWWMPEQDFRLLADCFDAIVVSNAGLQETLKEDYGYDSTLIRDRLPFQPKQKVHGPVEVPKFVWFGYSQNRAMSLNPVLFVLQRLANDGIPFRFRMIDDDNEQWKWSGDGTARTWDDWFEHVPWHLDTFEDRILECDIAVIPAYPGLWGHVKDAGNRHGHKTATASWLGMPVTDFENYKYIKSLLSSHEYRAKEGAKQRRWATVQFDIYRSVDEWKSLIGRLCESDRQIVPQ